jgi:transposase-like protein
MRSLGQSDAARTLVRDWEKFVTFYDFPQEHWIHLRTTNPLESVLSAVRLRTDVAKRARKRENALYLVFKIVERLSQNWRALNGGATVMALVRSGAIFKDGALQQPRRRDRKEVRAA